jgi:ribonuclease HII
VSLREVPLAELRLRVRASTDPAERRRLADALAQDPRAGARDLGGRTLRALAREEAEELRMARLFALRSELIRSGANRVAGVDEVGMGPLAGPVVAAAVILPDRVDLPGLDDSKRLGRARREDLARRVLDQALAVSVAEVDSGEVDRLNIYRAGLEAMRRAVASLDSRPDHVLVDARTIPDVAAPQTAIVGGDAKDASIAAASIVAKVHRDGLMRVLDAAYPGYGFARHKGYGTPEHLDALRRLGPCAIHRRSFAPVARHRAS